MVSTQTSDLVVFERDVNARSLRPVGDIVQELAQYCGNAGCKQAQGGQEILLDVEIGDLRCILLRSHPQDQDSASPVTLSPREIEIARMIAQGYPNKIIADVLDISSWTVGTHVRHLFAKLNVTSRAAMVAKIAQLLPQDRWNQFSWNKTGPSPLR